MLCGPLSADGTGDDVTASMQLVLRDFPTLREVWDQVAIRLSHVKLHLLQAFTACALGHALDMGNLGPLSLGSIHRTQIYAGLTGQRHPGNSARGLLALGPGKPFRVRPWPEPDVDFVLRAVAVWQAALPAYTAQCRQVLCALWGWPMACKALRWLLADFHSWGFRALAAQVSQRGLTQVFAAMGPQPCKSFAPAADITWELRSIWWMSRRKSALRPNMPRRAKSLHA